jgi:omega-hydroxy-beta-dihydromenaquinone-9 sulfotransferase
MRRESRCLPVYVLGVAHSGTSILQKMLGYHPEAAWFSQYSLRDGSVQGRQRVPFAHAVDRVLRRLVRYDWRKEKGSRLRQSIPRPGEVHTVALYVLTAESDSEAAERLRRVVDEECERWHRRVLIAKPLPLLGRFDLLGAAHPDARIIHIVRDGRAVAASLRHKFMRSGESAEEGVQRAAARWVDTIDEVERLGLPTLTLRYEEFCADVHGTLTRALGHATLDPRRFPFERVPRSLTATNARRVKELAAAEFEAVEATEAPRLRSLGYFGS